MAFVINMLLYFVNEKKSYLYAPKQHYNLGVFVC